jgi:NHL repeat
MSISKMVTIVSALVLATFALSAPPAGAHATRELLTSFGSLAFNGATGLAVDLETGNVYVADNNTQTIHVFGPTGGAPTNGVPAQITEVYLNESEQPSGVAVDNSCYEHQPRLTGRTCEEYDPSYGDVYVVKQSGLERGIVKFKLNPGHGYEPVATISIGPYEPYENAPDGLTVDSRGNLYIILIASKDVDVPSPVIEFKKIVEKIVNGGVEEVEEKLEGIIIPQAITTEAAYIAVDNFGDIYAGSKNELGGPREGYDGVAKLRVGAAGNVLAEGVLVGNQVGARRPVAVNPSTGAVYVGENSQIAEYNSAGALQLTFGSVEPFGGSLGTEASGAKAIAVNGETELIYVANPLHGDIDVFGPVLVPAVVEAPQPAASSIGRTSALLAGTANPESGHASYYFEYVDDGEYAPAASDPYSAGGRTPIEALAGGRSPETVERVVLTGLLPGTTYHYRMVVGNPTGTTYGPDQTFTTAPATPPAVATGSASEVGATSATLSGVVGPRGLPTSYVFEVGTDTSYGGAKLFGDAGASTGEVAVSVALQYLVPGTTYHYRLVATSFDGSSYGQDGTFTTPGVPSTVVQPAGAPLIASPAVQFPSIAGAITVPQGAAKSKQKVPTAAALRVCRRQRPGRRRVACEARARKLDRRAAKTNHSKKR